MVVPATSSAGVSSAGQLVALNSSGVLDSTMLPAGSNSGTASLAFGASPGTTDTNVAVTGLTGILNTSTVNVFIQPIVTSDHSIDEHWVEEIEVYAGPPSAGAGFTIYGVCRNGLAYGSFNVAYTWF